MIYLFFSLSVCGQNNNNSQEVSSSFKIDTTIITEKSMSEYSPTIENAHPNAKKFMDEELYWDVTEETSPFGNDDGADTFAGFQEWRVKHKDENTKVFLMEQIGYWGYPMFDLNEINFDKLEPYLKRSDLGSRLMSGIDAAIISIAFGQLYLEGTIDKEFIETAKTAINRQLIPEMLNLWGETYKIKRETQLKKMLLTLKKLG